MLLSRVVVTGCCFSASERAMGAMVASDADVIVASDGSDADADGTSERSTHRRRRATRSACGSAAPWTPTACATR